MARLTEMVTLDDEASWHDEYLRALYSSARRHHAADDRDRAGGRGRV